MALVLKTNISGLFLILEISYNSAELGLFDILGVGDLEGLWRKGIVCLGL